MWPENSFAVDLFVPPLIFRCVLRLWFQKGKEKNHWISSNVIHSEYCGLIIRGVTTWL